MVFKLFEVFKLDTIQAIVINYLVAAVLGFSSSNISFTFVEIPYQPWFLGAFILGFLFITVFQVMALTSQVNGLSSASVSSKMSVVIPISFGVLMYGEGVGLLKLLGIFLALIAVYLTSLKATKKEKTKATLLYPALLFFGSGCIDTSLKYIESRYVGEDGVPVFSATIFAFAFLFGLVYSIYKISKNEFKFHWKNILGGIALGIPNYYSIVYLLKALNTDGLESSSLFTLNNVGIVILSTLLGLLFFKEKLQIKNWIGIAIAIISISLIAGFS